MSTPFDPQPCCGGGAGVQDVNILNTVTVNEPVDVNVVSPVPLDVNVVNTVTIAEPVDVNVLNGTVSVGGSTAAVSTLTAATTGTGTTVDFLNAKSNVTMMVQVNGTVTSGNVALQASHDSTNWVTLELTAALATGVNQYVSLVGGAFRWFRGLVTENVAGGGNVTCTLMFA